MRNDLSLDCAVENERKAESYVTCSKCGELCIGLAFNKFLCPECNYVEYCDAEQQKALMGDVYAEIDEQELSEALKEIS